MVVKAPGLLLCLFCTNVAAAGLTHLSHAVCKVYLATCCHVATAPQTHTYNHITFVLIDALLTNAWLCMMWKDAGIPVYTLGPWT